VETLLRPSRAATGVNRLREWIAFLGGYIPRVHGVARALMAMQDTDDEARAAWADRMQAVHEGCAAAISALETEGLLADGISAEEATDLLWAQLSVPTWELLVQRRGWDQARYIEVMTRAAMQVLVKGA